MAEIRLNALRLLFPMVKPVILTVDDEPVVLKAVDRDLQTRYQRDYQIIFEGSGREALETVLKHKQRNTAIALFLADCV